MAKQVYLQIELDRGSFYICDYVLIPDTSRTENAKSVSRHSDLKLITPNGESWFLYILRIRCLL